MKILRLAACAIILFVAAADLHAEYIFLKDGSIHKGSITSETAAVVTLKLENGSVRGFNRGIIMRILYTDIYMGKHFIRLNTGEMIEAYQVDEDNETITFRKELNQPQEFTVKRSNVLFMTRTNPTGLEGKPNVTEIQLAWLAPFQAPRYYNVYIKERKEDKYRLAGKTGSRKYAIKGLATKKTYFFIVTAVGIDGNESVPSNEIQMRTNLQPERPPFGTYALFNKKKASADVKLTWKQSRDPDGTVLGYRVYQKRQYAIEKIDETQGFDSTIPEVSMDRDNHFMIRALDDDGAESENRVVSILLRRVNITANLGCVLPVGKFGDLMDPGAAVTLNASLSNFGVNYLYAGLEIGYMRTSCKVDRSYALDMVPVAASAAYQFEISPLFSLVPRLSFGFSYLHAPVVKPDLFTKFSKKKLDSFDPLLSVGLAARFQIIEMLSAGIDVSYGIMFEKQPMQFLTFSGSMTMRFKI